MILAKEPNFLQKPPQNLGLAIDGYAFPERPADVFASGREHRVDMLLGNVTHEWVPRELDQSEDAEVRFNEVEAPFRDWS